MERLLGFTALILVLNLGSPVVAEPRHETTSGGVLARESTVIDAETYTFEKRLADDHEIRGIDDDANGRGVNKYAVSRPKPTPRAQARVSFARGNQNSSGDFPTECVHHHIEHPPQPPIPPLVEYLSRRLLRYSP